MAVETNPAPANSLTFTDPETGAIIYSVEFTRPVHLPNVFTSWKTRHIIDDLARSLGMDCDEIGVPEHRKHIDPEGCLLMGHGVEYLEGGTKAIDEHVFEVTCNLHLTAGKRTETGCTYVGTDRRTLTCVCVKNYASPL